MGAIGTPDRYVDPDATGGTYNGLTQATAWQSIADITGLSAGFAIACNYAATDTLAGGFTSATAATVTANIILYSADFADDSWRAGFIIDGTSTIADAISGAFDFWKYSGITIKNMTGIGINGSTSENYFSVDRCVFMNNDGFDISGNNGVTVNDSTSLNNGDTFFDADIGCSASNCYVFNATEYGIAMRGGISDCVFDTCGTAAINATGSTGGDAITGCTFYNCAIGVDSSWYTLNLFKNIFASCPLGIVTIADSFLIDDYNEYYDYTTARTIGGGRIDGGHSVDTVVSPLTDPANKDYSRVTGTSIVGLARRIGAPFDATTTTDAFITAGLPPEASAGGGGPQIGAFENGAWR